MLTQDEGKLVASKVVPLSFDEVVYVICSSSSWLPMVASRGRFPRMVKGQDTRTGRRTRMVTKRKKRGGLGFGGSPATQRSSNEVVLLSDEEEEGGKVLGHSRG